MFVMCPVWQMRISFLLLEQEIAGKVRQKLFVCY